MSIVDPQHFHMYSITSDCLLCTSGYCGVHMHSFKASVYVVRGCDYVRVCCCSQHYSTWVHPLWMSTSCMQQPWQWGEDHCTVRRLDWQSWVVHCDGDACDGLCCVCSLGCRCIHDHLVHYDHFHLATEVYWWSCMWWSVFYLLTAKVSVTSGPEWLLQSGNGGVH